MGILLVSRAAVRGPRRAAAEPLNAADTEFYRRVAQMVSTVSCRVYSVVYTRDFYTFVSCFLAFGCAAASGLVRERRARPYTHCLPTRTLFTEPRITQFWWCNNPHGGSGSQTVGVRVDGRAAGGRRDVANIGRKLQRTPRTTRPNSDTTPDPRSTFCTIHEPGPTHISSQELFRTCTRSKQVNT